MNKEEVTEEFYEEYLKYKENNLKPLVLCIGDKKIPTLENKNKDIRINFYINEESDIYYLIYMYLMENDIDDILLLYEKEFSDIISMQLIKIVNDLKISIRTFNISKIYAKVRKKVNDNHIV